MIPRVRVVPAHNVDIACRVLRWLTDSDRLGVHPVESAAGRMWSRALPIRRTLVRGRANPLVKPRQSDLCLTERGPREPFQMLDKAA